MIHCHRTGIQPLGFHPVTGQAPLHCLHRARWEPETWRDLHVSCPTIPATAQAHYLTMRSETGPQGFTTKPLMATAFQRSESNGGCNAPGFERRSEPVAPGTSPQ